MRIKIFYFISLFLVWSCLVGLPVGVLSVIYSTLVPSIVFVFAIKFELLPKKTYFKLSAVLYFFWLAKEIFISSIKVSLIAWRRVLAIQPALDPVKTIQKNDASKVLYANSITLTPGTVTLSMEDKHLLVHALDFIFLEELKDGEMDAKILEISKK